MSKKITVNYNNEPCYNIFIEKDFSNLLNTFNELNITNKKLCIVTDTNVGPLYADEVKCILEKTGNQVFCYTIQAGEEFKTLDTVADVYEFLIINKFDRSDMLVALGGGVVGDLTGYTAATYLRGINFIQIPTTLLSQVDSSIGGKTGVDFRAYKNMVGAFHMPKMVYSNIGALKSLSKRLFNCGLGEIIKHGLIKDYEYYKWLGENINKIKSLDNNALEEMIYISDCIKKDVVEKDPTEKGDRALLNFGHTLGHAIEKLKDFKLYHGECVVLGMIVAMKISLNRGLISEEEYNNSLKMFDFYNFPVKISDISISNIIDVSKNDKKMISGKIKFILLKEIGNAYIDTTVTDDEMEEALKSIM